MPGRQQRIAARVSRHLSLKEKIKAHQLLKVTHFMDLPPASGAGKTKHRDLKNHEAGQASVGAAVILFNF